MAGVVLNERGEILLLEHVFHRTYPWGLPGGWMARGESPVQALRRELRQEVGLEIAIEALLAIEPGRDPRELDVGYLCRTCPGRGQLIRLNHEILSVRWVAPHELPEPIPPFHKLLITRAMQ